MNQRAWLERGILSAREGHWDVAERAFTEAILRSPTQWEAYVNRGNVHQERGDLDAAIRDFSHAVAIGPPHVAPHFNRGNARAVLGDLDGALSDYTAAIARDPACARAFELRGHVHQRRGDDGRAEEDLTRAIELAPDRADPYGNRAAIRAYRGAVELAMADCEAALDRMPRGSQKRDPIARLLSTLTRAKEGLRVPIDPPPSGPRARPTMDLRAKFLRALDGAGLDYTTRRRKTGVAATVRVASGDKITIVLDEEAPRLAFEATRESASRMITWERVTPITARASVPKLRSAIEGAIEAWRARRPRSRRAS